MATNFNSTDHFSKFNGPDISEHHAKNLIVAANSDTVRVGVGPQSLEKFTAKMVMAAQWLYEQVEIFSPLDVIGKEAADRLYLILVVSETCSKFGGQRDIRGEDAYGHHEDRPTDFPRFLHATTEYATTGWACRYHPAYLDHSFSGEEDKGETSMAVLGADLGSGRRCALGGI